MFQITHALACSSPRIFWSMPLYTSPFDQSPKSGGFVYSGMLQNAREYGTKSLPIYDAQSARFLTLIFFEKPSKIMTQPKMYNKPFFFLKVHQTTETCDPIEERTSTNFTKVKSEGPFCQSIAQDEQRRW